jgi:serine/threonine-protein kinase SRPK3
MDGYFWVNGPNGRCLCLVSSVAGPSIAQLTQSGLRLSGPHAQRIVLQLTQCVSFLHSDSEGIGHGDLTSNNVLLELANFDHCTEDEVYQRLGRPKEDNVRTLVGDSNGSQAPKYLVEPADLSQLNSYLTGNIRVIDFGESFFLGNPRNKSGTPPAFRAPEIFFNRNVLNGKASDVWALACTIYEIRAGHALFEIEFGDENTIQNQIIKALGPITSRTFSGIPGDIDILGSSESDYPDLIGLVRRIQRTNTGALISKLDLENGGGTESYVLNSV